MGYCVKCERRWDIKLYAQAHCSACCNHFTRVSVFDKHRVGDGDSRRCLDYDEMVDKGLRYNDETKMWSGEAMPQGTFPE